MILQSLCKCLCIESFVEDNECSAHEKTPTDRHHQSSKDEVENIIAALQTLLCNTEYNLLFQ